MVVLPVFLTMMRKVTLLPMFTGPLVGMSRVLVTTSAGLVMDTLAEPVPIVAPTLAVAEFVAETAEAMAVNETEIFVVWPGVSKPRLVQVKAVAVTIFGVRPADWKLKLEEGKLSVNETLVSVVLPTLTTCKLNCIVSPTKAWPLTGEFKVLLTDTPGMPGSGKIVAVALD